MILFYTIIKINKIIKIKIIILVIKKLNTS